MKKVLCLICSVALAAVFVTACGGENGDTQTAEGSGEQTVVRFLNWGDYIDTDTIAQFEEENPDIKIEMTTVPSNEEMYVVASTEGTDIDLICPSEYMTQKMIKEDLLAPIDTSKMENYKYVQDYAENYSYEGSLEYAVPYSWGTFGIVYNKTMVDEPIDSYGVLFDEKYAGKILMYDSMRDTIGIALKYLGYSMNSTDQAEIDEATDLLIAQKKDGIVLAYGTDDIRMSMANGSAAIALLYAGDAVYTHMDNEDIEYVIPKEGANIFVDNFCILKNTDCYDATLKFIDFLCQPEIAYKNAAYTGYSTPCAEATEMFGEEFTSLNSFNPSDDELKNVEYYKDLGEDLKIYENAWIKIKSN